MSAPHPPAAPPASRPPDSGWARLPARLLRAIWSAGEHHRVAAVGVGAAVVLAVIGVVATNRIDDIGDGLTAMADDARPAREALEATEHALRSSQYEFAGLLLEEDAVQRTLRVEDIRQTLNEGETAWRDYVQRSMGLPGERELQAEYERLGRRREELTGPVGFMLVRPEQVSVESILESDEFAEMREVQEQQRVIVATLIDEHYVPLIDERLETTTSAVERGRDEVQFLLIGSALLGLVLFAVAFRSAREHEREQALLLAERARQAERNELEATLQRALGMAADEPRALAIVGEALASTLPDLPVELLLSDAAVGHFRQVVATGPRGGGDSCPVGSPDACPAAQGTETKVFRSSRALDSCPHLRERPGPARSAVCVPVTIGGRSLGVLHAVGADGEPADAESADRLELVGDRAGHRLTLLRAMVERETQARSDPLTGLLNRRSLEAAIRPLMADGTPYVVAFGDLDRFKALNDQHGHEVGDRALRLFARVLTESLRPDDIACRYGGEEFVLVLPDISIVDGAEVVERVRRTLAGHLRSGTLPRYTVSFGLADSSQADDFAGVVRLADKALLDAKAAGRDRVLIAGEPARPAQGEGDDTEIVLPDA